MSAKWGSAVLMSKVRQDSSNRLYRQIAKVIGAVLGSSELVARVYVHRSLAAGEISIGRSDIDLAIITHRTLDGSSDVEALLSLLRRVRLLHGATRVLGECEVHGPGEAEMSARIEPFWGSLARRTAFSVYGGMVELPYAPISIEHAAARTVNWMSGHLPRAVRMRNGRALRKFALDAWNGYLTATGYIEEPYVTRSECERSCRELGGWTLPSDLGRHPDVAFSLYCRIGGLLHQRLLTPLASIAEPLVFRARLPPRLGLRTFVILPDEHSALPPQALSSDSVLATPELLDLFLHFCNPFAFAGMPPELIRLGFRTPDPGAFLRACRIFASPFRIRAPGFINADTRSAVGRVALVRDALRSLEMGRIPPSPSDAVLDEIRATPSSVGDYYRIAYSGLSRELERIWAVLDESSAGPEARLVSDSGANPERPPG